MRHLRPSVLVLVVVGAAGVPAVAGAASDWPPADKQEYVDSGRYLADVQAAAAPARAWLVSRTDQLAADREACRAAGLPFPAPVRPVADGGPRPAAAASGAALRRAAGAALPAAAGAGAVVGAPAGAGAPAAAAPAAGAGAPAGMAPAAAAAAPAAAAARAAAPSWVGATTLAPSGRSGVVRALRRAGVRLETTAPATASWRRVLLPVGGGRFAGRVATATHGRTLRLAAAGRTVALRDVRVTASGRAVRLTARLGGTRRTVLVGTASAADRTVDPAGGVLRVAGTPVRLTTTAARGLGRGLRIDGLRAGAFGTLAVRATRSAAPGPGGAAAPAPAPGEDARPPVAATPPTASSCAALPARPAVVLDIDETALSNYLGTFGDPEGGSAGYAAVSVFGAGTALGPVFDIYAEARRRGVAVFFVTARPGIIEPSTVGNLRRVGYDAWDGLTFKNDLTSAKDVHKTAERRKIEAAGYRIVLNVGDQQTDIDGGVAERAFKLPNPFY